MAKTALRNPGKSVILLKMEQMASGKEEKSVKLIQMTNMALGKAKKSLI
jgi:hypothetical protein